MPVFPPDICKCLKTLFFWLVIGLMTEDRGLSFTLLKLVNTVMTRCVYAHWQGSPGTWPSLWNHYAWFLPPAERRWDVRPTYYSPDVPVIHHCLPCPHRALEDVWSTASFNVCVCLRVCVWVYKYCTYLLACMFTCLSFSPECSHWKHNVLHLFVSKLVWMQY